MPSPRGEVSAEELVHACLDRISAREDEVRAFECLDPGYALDQARNLDNGPRLGPPPRRTHRRQGYL